MNALFECIATLSARQLGTVVHVGAGDGQLLDHYARFAPARLVLVEGDPDALAGLRQRAASVDWASVCAQPVAAQPGPLAWHRYNLPALNGPVNAAALRDYYPRLAFTETRSVAALSFTDLIAGLQLSDSAQRTDVLVLDVPGQEADLLASLPMEQLARFGAVVLRGCSQPLSASGGHAAQAVAELQARYFNVAALEVQQSALWPVTLLCFDEHRYQTAQREQKLVALLVERDVRDACARAELAAAVRALDEQASLAAERLTQLESFAQAKAYADQVASDREEKIRQVAQAWDEQSALAAERFVQLEQLSLARDEQSALAAERWTQVDSLAKAKAVAEQLANDRAAKIRQVGQAYDEQSAVAAERLVQLEQLSLARDELAALASERLTQLEALSLTKAQADHALNERAVQIAQVSRERDEQAHWHEENAKWAQGLKAQLEVALARLQDLEQELQARQVQLDAATQALATARQDGEQLARAGQDREHAAAAEAQRLALELTEARQTVNLSVKMQALREADLRDLQGRYQSALQEQQSQHELLTKLGQRLMTANQYFHQLALSKQVSVELEVQDEAAAPAKPARKAAARRRGAAAP